MKLIVTLWITFLGLFLCIKSETQFPGPSWGTEKKTYIDIDNSHNDFVDDVGSGNNAVDTDDTTDDEDLLESGSGDEGSGSGNTLVAATTKAPTTKKMTACQQLRSSTKDFASDFYIPECTITGEYEKRQCEGKPGSKKCWCVDPKGREIPGTQMEEPHFPDCHEGKNLKSCVFDLLKNSRGLLGAYRPRCTISGEYEKIQCHIRECWCVDEKGIEKDGTRIFMTSSPPVCEDIIKPSVAPPVEGGVPSKAPSPDTTKKVHHHDKDKNVHIDDDKGYDVVNTPSSVDVSIGGGKFDEKEDDEDNDINKSEQNIKNKPEAQTTFLRIMESPGMLAAVIGGSVVGLLCAILLVMFIVYRMRKKDEGSYPLEEQKYTNYSYMKAPDKEFYA